MMYIYTYNYMQHLFYVQQQLLLRAMLASQANKPRTFFPELVGRRPREAATYVSARGLFAQRWISRALTG